MLNKIHLRAVLMLVGMMSAITVVAQDVIVSVMPVQDILPPQVMMYLSSPEKYFNVTLTNTTNVQQDVYLGITIDQVNPRSGLSIITPPKRQPTRPFSIQAGANYRLTSNDLRHLFDHIPANEISAPQNLFDNYMDGSFAMLPEGQYQVRLTAYRWNPSLQSPLAVSNPASGIGLFNVCYSAQPPEFLAPVQQMGQETRQLDMASPLFIWSQPVITCNPRVSSFEYSMRIVQLLPGQQPDRAIEQNPVVYQVKNLRATQCMIPALKLREMRTDCDYVAQVTATSTNTNAAMLDYVMIENRGQSHYIRFRLVDGNQQIVNNNNNVNDDDDNDDDKDDDNVNDNDDDDDKKADVEHELLFGDGDFDSEVDDSKLYTFKNPTITSPSFLDDGSARKKYSGEGYDVEWRKVQHVGGDGAKSDTLKFRYVVELFNGSSNYNRGEVLAGNPIFSNSTDETKLTIEWDEIKELVVPGDYLLIRVRPTCTNAPDDVAFTGDSLNVVDFALVQHVSKKYFECSSTTEIDDTEPSGLQPEEYKNKTVALGQYSLTIDKISTSKTGVGYDGEGRVEWNPLGLTVKLAVSFDSLQINKDGICYGGLAVTKTSKEMSNAEAITAIFSDTGLDDLITNSGLPNAGAISNAGKQGIAKALGKKAQIGHYYSEIKNMHLDDWALNGGADNVMMPLALPEEITNQSPVNIQITTFRFAPTWATMDLVGSFQVDGCDWTENDVLMFGAPRLCISPDEILPESGTLALLADFTVVEPTSGYKMTFNAPKDLLQPKDGCYVSWHADAFEMLGVDIDMKIPGLKKDVNGEVTDELPNLKVMASIGNEWHDWMVDDISMDPFQADDLPGYTFTATDIVYDHSIYRNSASMGNFPVGYDKAWLQGGLNNWEGLYIKEVAVRFPKSLELGEKNDAERRLKLSVQGFFFDDSGVSFDAGVDNAISAKTGKLGGWGFTLDRASLQVVQNDFSRCGFSGTMDVPFTDSSIGYNCNIYKQKKNSQTEGYAYIFTTQQLQDQMTIDLFLADLQLDKKQTYFIVESVPENGNQVTRVELMMGGEMSIGASKKQALQDKINSSPLKIDIPDVHFAGLRFANCQPWESKYDNVEALHKGSKNASLKGKKFVEDKTYSFANGKFFISRGAWSVASVEKKLGSFRFTLEKYDFTMNGTDEAQLSLKGGVGLMDEMLSADAAVTLKAKIKGLNKAASLDFSELAFESVTPKFEKLSVSGDFAGSGLKLAGSLEVREPTQQDPSRGFAGSLKFTLPQNLFTIDAKGGFYNYEGSEKYRWGYFEMAMGGSALQCPPIEFTKVSGGFYFNCKRNDKGDGATPQKGVIGIYAAVGIGMSGAPETLNGEGEFVISYDSKNKKFSTIKLTVDAHAIASKDDLTNGMVNAKVMILYEDSQTDRYIQITATADASADVSKEVYKQLAGNLPEGVTQKIQNALSQFDSSNDENNKAAGDKNSVKKSGNTNGLAKMEASINLELRFELEMKNKANQPAYYTTERTSSKCKWHVYLGKPNRSERCRISLIDFHVGKKTDPVALWAELYANGYLCFGNELPEISPGVILPPIPDDVKKFLDGEDVNGKMQSLSTTADTKRQSAVTALLAKGNKGGLMFGAEAGGSFGCNAVIAYADVTAKAGFDVLLQNLADGATCGSAPAGKKGWYGVGQAYAMLKGEIGLMLNLWIFEGKLPLVDAGLGALLEIGLPNPTWIYGKVRAKCSLFGGLIDFNKAIEIEAGNICTPEGSNPLDDIEIFGDINPDFETERDGWDDDENRVDPYLIPRFSTNMKIGKQITLCQEAAGSVKKKTYVFYVNKTNLVSCTDDRRHRRLSSEDFENTSTDKENYTLKIASLEPNTCYMMTLSGYAMEVVNGKEVAVYVKDPQTKKNVAWTQTATRYFRTGPLPDHLVDKDIAIAMPGHVVLNGDGIDAFKSNVLFTTDAKKPYLSLTRSRSDLANASGKTLWMRVEKQTNLGVWQTEDEKACQEITRSFTNDGKTSQCILWQPASDLSYTPKSGNKYRLLILRRDEAKHNQYMANAKQVTTTKDSQGKVGAKYDYTSAAEFAVNNAYGGDKVSLKSAMDKIATSAETDQKRDYTKETTKEFNANNKSVDDFYEVMYNCEFTVIDYKNVMEYIKSLANNNLNTKSNCELLFTKLASLEESGSRRFTYDCLGWIYDNYLKEGYSYSNINKDVTGNVSYAYKNPYVYLAYLATYAGFPSFTINQDYLYAATKKTSTKTMNFFMNRRVPKTAGGVNYITSSEEMLTARLDYEPTCYFHYDNNTRISAIVNKIRPNYSSEKSYNTSTKTNFYQRLKAMVANDAYEAEQLSKSLKTMTETFDEARKDFQSWRSQVSYMDSGVEKTKNYSYQLYQIPLIYGATNGFKGAIAYPLGSASNAKQLASPLISTGTRAKRASTIYSMLKTTFSSSTYLNNVNKISIRINRPMYYYVKGNQIGQYYTEGYYINVPNPFK